MPCACLADRRGHWKARKHQILQGHNRASTAHVIANWSGSCGDSERIRALVCGVSRRRGLAVKSMACANPKMIAAIDTNT